MPACDVCKKTSEELSEPLQQCTKCKKRIFCGEYAHTPTQTSCFPANAHFFCTGRECQIADWPHHKLNCGKVWYDKHRKCQDGYKHEGKLELITWNSVEDGYEKGWGNVVIEESDDMRTKFEEEFKGDEAKLYEYWPQAFRWTCCGTDAGMDWGCDHHGSGSRACTCDYCRYVSTKYIVKGGRNLNTSITVGLDSDCPTKFTMSRVLAAWA